MQLKNARRLYHTPGFHTQLAALFSGIELGCSPGAEDGLLATKYGWRGRVLDTDSIAQWPAGIVWRTPARSRQAWLGRRHLTPVHPVQGFPDHRPPWLAVGASQLPHIPYERMPE